MLNKWTLPCQCHILFSNGIKGRCFLLGSYSPLGVENNYNNDSHVCGNV